MRRGKVSSIVFLVCNEDKRGTERRSNVNYLLDAPKHIGTYQERYNFAQQHIHGYVHLSLRVCRHEVLSLLTNKHRKSEIIQMIPYVVCLDAHHLQQRLKEVTDREGEGLMLYEPNAIYTPGRTYSVLKLKV